MESLDINLVGDDEDLHFDICIVGGGAAGITIARELAGTNLKVGLLESGSNEFDEKTQRLYDFENVGHPVRAQQGYISRNRYFGGSTNSWHGRSAPFGEVDFQFRDWIPNSGWPICRKDIEPYYERANKVLKLPDFKNFGFSNWKKFTYDYKEEIFAEDALEAQVYLFSKKPINMRTTYGGELASSSNIQVLLNANVTSINLGSNLTSVHSVTVKTLKGKTKKVTAKKFILACGGWENARILLMSNKQLSKGVGNHSGNVGRYYMEHPKIICGKLFPKTKFFRSPIFFWQKKLNKDGNIRLTFKLPASTLEKEALPNHCIELKFPVGFQDSVASSEALFRMLGLPKRVIHSLVKLAPPIFRVLEKLERLIFNLPLHMDHILLFNHLEQVPNESSCLTLSNDLDALGCPKLKVNLNISKQDKESIIKFQQKMAERFEQLGLGTVEPEFPSSDQTWDQMTDSSHHMGTTRMSSTPEKGVVDQNCKVFGLSNLYIAGSSIFPTGGPINPTLNIVAFAIRLAEHIKGADDDR